jgi:excisionase family DNA binding protein
MAQRFLNLEEAAQQLGVAKDKLTQLREAGKARAFRDGSSWKFKETEVERLASEGIAELIGELAGEGSSEDVRDEATARDSDSELGEFDLSLDDDAAAGDSGAVLLNEQELGEDAGEGSSSTIIGKEDEAKQDSDLEISADVGGGEISDLALDMGSDLSLDDEVIGSSTGDASNVLSPSMGGSGVLDNDELGPAAKFEQLEELDLDLNSSQLSFAEDSIAEKLEPPPAAGGEKDAGAKPPPRGESSIKLATDEDDEVVLGEDSSSDITVDSHQSGISLIDSGDTGISLDQAPSGLGGSSVESFDLTGDDGFNVTDQVAAGSGSGVQEGSFVLPAADGGSASGSSSQIAFDLDSGVNENTATILGSEPSLGSELDMGGVETAAAPMLEEEPAAAGLEAVGAAAPAGAVTMSAAAIREAQYTGWNIAFLSLCSLLLLLSGAMMFDLLRNMWSWQEPYALNSGIMDAILNALF